MPQSPSRRSLRRALSVLVCLAPFLSIPLSPVLVNAQTQQPFLFGTQSSNNQMVGLVTFVRNDVTGELTQATGSPFATFHTSGCGPGVIDPKGRFLYGSCGLGAAMYTLDATTGDTAEVAGSPFGGSSDSSPGIVVAESTGNFVYVLKPNNNPNLPASSSYLLDKFRVDSTGEQLVPVSSTPVDLNGTQVGPPAANPHAMYIYTNQNEGGSSCVGVLYAIFFDPITGDASTSASIGGAGNNARNIALDALGTHLVLTSGQNCGGLFFFSLSPTDGRVTGNTAVGLGCGEFASPLSFDPSGHFLYLQFNGAGARDTNVHIFETDTGNETSSSPLPPKLEQDLGGLADPQGPFAYVSGSFSTGGILVFQFDYVTGYPSQPPGLSAPFFPGINYTLGIKSQVPNSQPIRGPNVSLSSRLLAFGPRETGKTSAVQTITLTNTGGQALSLSSILVSGANATDFRETDTCMGSPVLTSGKSCTINVFYAPAAAGTGLATISITDNAAGSPHQVSLTGTATAPAPPAPAVKLNPDPFVFSGNVPQGTTSALQNLVLTNSGNAPLHVQSVTLAGVNSTDFILGTDTCVGTLVANTNCVIPMTFSPIAAGVRTATLTITDDAANSPQVVTVDGNAIPAATIVAAPNGGSMSATVSAGQAAQYNLQAAPGAGFAGVLTLSCSGAPVGASCNVPANVTLGNGASTNFLVTVTTSGGAFSIPRTPKPRVPLSPFSLFLSSLLSLLVAALLAHWRGFHWTFARMRLWHAVVASGVFLLAVDGCGGGGGENLNTVQPAIVTPSSTYTIIVTPTATAAGSSKQLQLNAIPLTLTVK
jgi:Abnormal spindle-like microcephaly-assoc'd, ASPM-SPD-2-Hydin